MKLLEDLAYTDSMGAVWFAPRGWIVDGASIPGWSWSIVGSPFAGLYRDASVIHDVACDKREKPWNVVHRVFFEAMLTSGVGRVKALTMYGAVFHFGPRWDFEREIWLGDASANFQQDPATELYNETKDPPGSERKKIDEGAEITMGNYRGPAYFKYSIKPPIRTMTEADFDILQKKIAMRERISAKISLDEIDRFSARNTDSSTA